MMKRDSHLDQSLQKLLFRKGRGAPDVFERLVCFKELGTIKEVDSCPALLNFHATLWHTPDSSSG